MRGDVVERLPVVERLQLFRRQSGTRLAERDLGTLDLRVRGEVPFTPRKRMVARPERDAPFGRHEHGPVKQPDVSCRPGGHDHDGGADEERGQYSTPAPPSWSWPPG